MSLLPYASLTHRRRALRSTGDVVLLATNTITSGTTNSAFTSKITSTYSEYIFRFYNVHPATDNVYFDWLVCPELRDGEHEVTATSNRASRRLGWQ